MEIITVQPALPHYRMDFFRKVHEAMGDAFSVYYSPTNLAGITSNAGKDKWAKRLGKLKPIVPGLDWQEEALSIPFRTGDVVVVCGAPRTVSTLALIVKAKVKRAKVVWWGHFWTSTSKAWRFKVRMRMLQFCDAVLFYTEEEVEEFRKRVTGVKMPVHALNNGINTDPILQLRERYDPAKRANSIMFIGRLTPKAQLSTALEALAQVPAKIRPKFEVIGTGEEQDLLLQKSRSLGLEKWVIWHGPITDEERIASIANRSAMFVYPGEVGLSLVHAMAYGLPAIVHSDRWRQMPEIAAFEDQVTGRSFDYGDAASLAQTITDMATDQEALLRYHSSAVLRVGETYNTRDMASRFVDCIRLVAVEGNTGNAQ